MTNSCFEPIDLDDLGSVCGGEKVLTTGSVFFDHDNNVATRGANTRGTAICDEFVKGTGAPYEACIKRAMERFDLYSRHEADKYPSR